MDTAVDFGIPARRAATDWQKLVQGREQYIANINHYWDDHVEQSGIDRIQGFAVAVKMGPPRPTSTPPW
ncbi:hypothetical protein [Sedimenticola sp.]|uniref:hypothetical protein n=1 Tax=Sedimenticola sp. TaxID=1940285 RepID=UPI00258570E6|nr:hypothetical protein [Sedimenticola sp.]MCW8903978.1 hypothetical protein [Sedimenticola sp.]